MLSHHLEISTSGIGHISHVGFSFNGLIGIGNIVNSLQFEMKTKLSHCCMFVREGWLWCVRRVFSSLAGLNSVFGDALLQNATQLCFNTILQMNNYFVMREFEHIGDTSIFSQDGISIFTFPERFLEISWRDLTTFTISTTLLI
jgi:hypothetical protein